MIFLSTLIGFIVGVGFTFLIFYFWSDDNRNHDDLWF